MRFAIAVVGLLVVAALPAYTRAQGVIVGCTNTGVPGYIYCLPPNDGKNGQESARARQDETGVSQGLRSLFPPPPSPQELADKAVGLAIADNPQQAGEDDVDYTVRVTRIAREAVSQRSPQAAMLLLDRLVALDDLKIRMRATQAARERTNN